MKKVAFQINKITTLSPKTDSGLLIMNAAFARGFDVYFYYPEDLFYKEQKVMASGFIFEGEQAEQDKKQTLDLEEFDYIFIRQDPPYDMNYLTTTYLLEKLKNPKVLNNPNAIRSCPEKLFVLDFAHFMPKTIITNNEDDIRKLLNECGQIILKPLYAHGGRGVFLIPENDKNLFNTFRILKENYNNLPVIAQEYIPNVVRGDKRILFINGEFAGALNRVQNSNSAISNTAVGSGYEKTTLTKIEQEMCKTFLPIFKKLGLFLVGIDVIDDKITEINVTAPTGFCLINELYSIRIEEKILNEMLKL